MVPAHHHAMRDLTRDCW